jgi:DNA-binding NtrC family response regulator
MKNALVVQRHEYYRKCLQELLDELGFDSTVTNNLESALDALKLKKYDAVISGSIYRRTQETPDNKSDELWPELYKEVQKQTPEATFILYTVESVNQINQDVFRNAENPKINHVSKYDTEKESDTFRELLKSS